ncbi:MAG: metal-sensitive transcriptional regulator [Anaerolineae bacterium]
MIDECEGAAAAEARQRDTLVRLRRLEGQVRGLQGMLQEGRDCSDVLTQLLAIRSALDEVGARIVDSEVDRCLHSPMHQPEQLAKVIRLWLRLSR